MNCLKMPSNQYGKVVLICLIVSAFGLCDRLGAVPPQLRDSHYRGARALGHGVGYEYPHDDPRGFVEAIYLPEGHSGRRYYEPSEHGAEKTLAERWRHRRGEEPQGDKGSQHETGPQGEAEEKRRGER